MSTPRARIAIALLAFSAALVGCGEGPERHEVEIQDFAYGPALAVAKVGDTLVWTNSDLVPHTVTDVNGVWDSGAIAPGASWRLALEAGPDSVAYTYTCTYHPTMTGALVVQ